MNNGPIKCPYCGFGAWSEAGANTHYWKMHGSKPFRSDKVKPGDRLVLAKDESHELVFRDLTFGMVLARWIRPIDGAPLDMLGKQKDFRIPRA